MLCWLACLSSRKRAFKQNDAAIHDWSQVCPSGRCTPVPWTPQQTPLLPPPLPARPLGVPWTPRLSPLHAHLLHLLPPVPAASGPVVRIPGGCECDGDKEGTASLPLFPRRPGTVRERRVPPQRRARGAQTHPPLPPPPPPPPRLAPVQRAELGARGTPHSGCSRARGDPEPEGRSSALPEAPAQ
jgi:hypothetical protein